MVKKKPSRKGAERKEKGDEWNGKGEKMREAVQ